MIIWFVCGFIGSVIFTYAVWKEGHDIPLFLIPFLMISCFLGPFMLLFGLLRSDIDIILIKGKK